MYCNISYGANELNHFYLEYDGFHIADEKCREIVAILNDVTWISMGVYKSW